MPQTHVGAIAPPVTPKGDEAPTVASGQGLREQGTTDSADCEGLPGIGQPVRLADTPRAFVELRAQLKCYGYVLGSRRGRRDGRYPLWLARDAVELLPDLAAVAEFARKAGARRQGGTR